MNKVETVWEALDGSIYFVGRNGGLFKKEYVNTNDVDKEYYQNGLVMGELKPKEDLVNHPAHYKSETGLEAIDVIEAFTFDLTGVEAFDAGNALKYLCRWKSKNGLQDLKKAKWYLEHLINHVEKLEKENDEK